MITRRVFCVACAGLLAFPARAQRRLWRIGYHTNGSAESNAGWLDAFRKGMAELGWSEARDYVVDARYADGNAVAALRLATELVATQPDVVLTTAEASIFALTRATKAIPIVFATAGDPVGAGYAASLQRPGQNVTGITSVTSDLAAKRLQLLKEAYPRTARVCVLFEPGDPVGASHVRELEAVAEQVNVRLMNFEVRRAADLEVVFSKEGPGADSYIVVAGPIVNIHRKAIAQRMLDARRPSISSNVILAEAGFLMTYGASAPANFRRAAAYVDKILKGAKAGELPIERPTKLDLVINMRTAKVLGIEIPASLRLRADRVIE